MIYKTLIVKRKIEGVFIYPFVLLGRLIARLCPLQHEYEFFFFFPFYHTGGVEKYNLAVAEATAGHKGIIFFTRKSVDHTFYDAFTAYGHKMVDISAWTDNKWIYWGNLIYRGIVSGYINRQRLIPLVFNGQSNFGYKTSPWIKKDVAQYECIHTFSTFTPIRQPFIEFYKKVIVPSFKTKSDHLAYYRKIGVPEMYDEKFAYLITGTEIRVQQKEKRDFLQVLYVGRGSYEKRVHLVAQVAAKVHIVKPSVQFVLAGNVEGHIPADLIGHYHLLGNIADVAKLEAIYNESDVLILTSLFEGFPLVVMEAMVFGLCIVSTDVGDVPHHVKHGVNGYIASSVTDEVSIVDEMAAWLIELDNDVVLREQMAERNTAYAKAIFDKRMFKGNLNQILHFEKAING